MGKHPMQEFRIDTNALNEKRTAKRQLLSWGIVLLLFAMPVSTLTLGFLGLLSDDSSLRWLAWLSLPALLGAVIGTSILAFRAALRRAEREMVFVLDKSGIARTRKGYPEVRIAFSEAYTVREELRWLVVKSTEPVRKIAIPNNVKGYEVIRAELAKHHALSAQMKKLPLKSVVPRAISFLSWGAVLWFRDMRVVIPAGIIAMTLLALGSRRLWTLFPRGPNRFFSLVCLGVVWFSAILLIYFRVMRL
jgi:hypothetical protein